MSQRDYYYDLGCNSDGEIIFVIRSPEGRAMAVITNIGMFDQAKVSDAKMIVEALNAMQARKEPT